MRSYRFRPVAPRRQRGAVLYVALIMLILLAFQNAESSARQVETGIETALDGANVFLADQEECSPTYDPLTWANAITKTAASYTRRIDKCSSGSTGSSIKTGKRANEETGNTYQVTALASDAPTDASASAVIDTVFIP